MFTFGRETGHAADSMNETKEVDKSERPRHPKMYVIT